MMMVAKALFLALSLTWAGLLHAQDPIAQANQLISEGKNQEAFELLEPLEFDLSGDETFDLLFGYAALEAGHISLSTLALERVLAVNPDNNTARFHLARAYFVLNDYDGARREFEMLLSLNPTEGLRETVGQYLDAIIAREPASDTTISAYLSFGIGSDSNVNGAVTNAVLLPAFDNFPYPTDPFDQETEDNYATFTGGFDGVHKLGETNNVYFGGSYNQRDNDDRPDQDYGITAVRGGYQHAVGNQSYRAGLDLSTMEFAGADYQDTTGIELEWRNTLGDRTQIGLVLNVSQTRFDAVGDQVNDYDDNSLNFSVLRILGEEGRAILSGDIEVGSEDSLNGRDDGDMDYVGVSITGQYQFSDAWNGFLLLSLEEQDYSEPNQYYDEKRSDSQTSVIGGLIYSFAQSWSVRFNALLLDTESNLDLYTTDKTDVSIAIRKDFL